MPKLYAYIGPQSIRRNKAVITAALAGVTLDHEEPFDGSICDTPAYMEKCHPLGRCPVLETPDGCIFESNSIVRYLARLDTTDAKLYGGSVFEASQCDSWLDFVATEMESHVVQFLYNKHLGATDLDVSAATKATCEVFARLDAWLAKRTFLVGDGLTIADVVMLTALDCAFEAASTAQEFYVFEHVVRYYSTVMSQPKVSAALQSVGHTGAVADRPAA